MGRVLRFYLLAAVLALGGPSIRRVIQHHLPAVSIVVLLLMVAGFLLLRFFS
jgi:hypothetical protein